MQDNVCTDRPPHPSSGLIHLQARAAELGSLLGPTWAALCGILASNAFRWEQGDYVKLPLLLLLVDGGWGTVWSALAGTDWSKPLNHWHTWDRTVAGVSLPYTLPGTLGDRMSQWIGRARMWWHSLFWPSCGPAVRALLVGLPLTALLGALLGPELLLLSVAALALMEMALLREGGGGAFPPDGTGSLASHCPGWRATQPSVLWQCLPRHSPFCFHWRGVARGPPGQREHARPSSSPRHWRQWVWSCYSTLWQRPSCCLHWCRRWSFFPGQARVHRRARVWRQPVSSGIRVLG